MSKCQFQQGVIWQRWEGVRGRKESGRQTNRVRERGEGENEYKEEREKKTLNHEKKNKNKNRELYVIKLPSLFTQNKTV